MSTRTDLMAALAAIDSEIQAAEARVADLRLERRGAEALLRRLGVSTAEEPIAVESPRPRVAIKSWPAAAVREVEIRLAEGNTKIVADILATADEKGMSLSTIEERTHAQGTPLNNDQVRSAVTYLKRKNLAEQVTRGTWRLVGTAAPLNADSPTETVGLSDSLDRAPEGGEHTDGQEGSHHDHRLNFDGWNGDRDHLGAPVGH